MAIPCGKIRPATERQRSRRARAGQSRRASAVEAVTNVGVGYGVSVGLSWWLLGITPGHAAGVSVVFTAASLIRSYVLRRLFAQWGAGEKAVGDRTHRREHFAGKGFEIRE